MHDTQPHLHLLTVTHIIERRKAKGIVGKTSPKKEVVTRQQTRNVAMDKKDVVGGEKFMTLGVISQLKQVYPNFKVEKETPHFKVENHAIMDTATFHWGVKKSLQKLTLTSGMVLRLSDSKATP